MWWKCGLSGVQGRAAPAYNRPGAAAVTGMFAERTNWNLTPNRLSLALAERRSRGEQVLDLTASNPTACGFVYDQQAILRALANPGALAYSPNPRGLEPARSAVAGYYRERGRAPAVDDIFLTVSTSEAYSWILRTLCNPGDAVLVPAPGYPLFACLSDIADVRLVRYPLVYDHGWQMDFHALEQAVTPTTRAVVVVHPNNPTGHFTSAGEAERLGEFCASRGMAVIADEVFLDFAFEVAKGQRPGGAPQSFAGNTMALTFTLSGLSKICGLPQMKAAWLVVSGPEGDKEQACERLEVIADTFLSPNAPVQLALPALLELRAGFQRQVGERLRRNLAELDRQLAGPAVAASRLKVEGGWYAVIRVPATRPDEHLAVELVAKHGVYVHPGHFFDFPGNGYVVVSLLTPEPEFAEGIRLLLKP